MRKRGKANEPFLFCFWGGGYVESSIKIEQRDRTRAARGLRVRNKKKEEAEMKLTKDMWFRGTGRRLGLLWVVFGLAWIIWAKTAQAQIATTTVQGIVYLANGHTGSGTLIVSWPSFTTAAGQAVAADSTKVSIGQDGFFSVNLAPNLGALPAGLYYTAVYQMSDGSTSTEYRRLYAAKLFGVFSGAIYQFAVEQLTVASCQFPVISCQPGPAFQH